MARGERTSWQALSTWCCSPATSSSFSNHERTGSPPPHSRTRRDCPSGECRLRRHAGDRTALASIAARRVPGVGSRRLFGSASAAPRALQHPGTDHRRFAVRGAVAPREATIRARHALGLALAQLLGLHPVLGLVAGSITLVGGHGTG